MPSSPESSPLRRLQHLKDRVRKAALRFPEQSLPLVSVLVPMFGQGDLSLDCLEALASEASQLPLEVLLIDDASPDGSGAAFESLPGLRLIKNPRNLGYLRSCNKAALQARGDYLLLLNNDTRVQPGALKALLQVFQERPDAGLVGAKFVYPDGRLQEAGARVLRDGSAVKQGRDLDEKLPEFNRLEEADYCSGAGLMIPRALFLELGGYDDIFLPSHYEDVDLAFEVRQSGRKVYYQPAATIVHWEGATCGAPGPLNHTLTNQPKFRRKWQAVLDQGLHPSAQKP